MTFDAASMQATVEAASTDSAANVDQISEVHQVSVGHGGSLTSDVALFGDTIEAARQREILAVPPVVEVMMEPLNSIDREAAAFGETAQAAMKSGNELTPSEILDLTVRSQEFMFHSQLTANIANRTADGLQQLFRQQG